MLLLVTYTLLAKDGTDEETLGKIVIKFKNKILEQYVEKKYIVEKLTMGLHQNANRLHWHMGHLVEIGEKKIIHWDKHLRGLITLADFDNSIKEKIDIKITFNDKVGSDDILNVLAYPLKEYTIYSEIREIKQFIGLEEKELEAKRDYAHQIYLTAKYERKCKEEKKIIREDSLTSKWQFLDEELKIECLGNKLLFKERTIESKIREVYKILLRYEKLQNKENDKKSFRINCVRDNAISYCYLRGLASEDEISDYARI